MKDRYLKSRIFDTVKDFFPKYNDPSDTKKKIKKSLTVSKVKIPFTNKKRDRSAESQKIYF